MLFFTTQSDNTTITTVSSFKSWNNLSQADIEFALCLVITLFIPFEINNFSSNWVNCLRKRKQWLLFGGQLLRLSTLTQPRTNSQINKQINKIRLHVRHAKYFGCPSAVWRDQLLPVKAALNWTQLVFLRHTSFAVRLDCWDFKGKILLMHLEQLLSEVSQLHQMFSNHLDSFILERLVLSPRCLLLVLNK